MCNFHFRLWVVAFVLLFLAFSSTNLKAQPYTLFLVADQLTPIPGGFGLFDNFGDPVSLDLGDSEVFGGLANPAQGIYTNIGGAPVLVADELTPIPGGIGTFTGFNDPVQLGGGDIAFVGFGSSGQSGIYTSIGGTLEVVADLNTAIPGGTGNFTSFGVFVSLGGGDVAFRGAGSGQVGIYTSIGGTLAVVADLNTAIPGGSGNFTNFTNFVSLGGGDVAFLGSGSSGQVGIYTSIGGTLEVVADLNTAIPAGTGNFTGFNAPVSLGGGDIAFLGFGSGQQGIYMSIGGTLEVVADLNTAIPGGTGNFTAFNDPVSLGGGDVAFRGLRSGQVGIYTSIGGTLAVVADLNTAIPGGSGNFTGFATPVSLGGGDVAFRGFGSSGQQGIYMSIGGTLEVVADLNTAIPGGSGNFTNFTSFVSLGGGDVAFIGTGSSAQQGIYISIGGTLAVVADLNTAIPGGSGNFTAFNDPVSLGSGYVAFKAVGSGQEGIYTSIGGTLALVADLNTAIPGGSGNFTVLHVPVSLGGGDVAFRGFGSSGQTGLYASIGGTLAVVADINTAIPGGSGNFTVFGLPVSLGGGDVAFFGFGSSGQEGIYTSIGGTLAVVADKNTAIPGGSGNFTGFGDPVSLGGGDVAFRGLGSGQEGIYTSIGGTLAVVADKNTAIPGGSGNFTGFGIPVSLGGGDVAFRGLGSGQEGIYTSIGGTLAVVADKNTAIPGGSGNFTSFIIPVSLGGGDVAFAGLGSSAQLGIYTSIGGTLAVVADLNTAIPGGSGNFAGFAAPVSLGGGDFAFIGTGSSAQQGIYISIGGTLAVVADKNTAIPGGSGNFDLFNVPVSLGGGDFAFRGGGSSGQRGIYSAFMNEASLTIVKETDPDGATGFEFAGTGFPGSCSLDGTFILDDDMFNDCDLPSGSYTVQETNTQGFDITDIDCVGTSDFSVTDDSVTVNLMNGENVVCTFTNTGEFSLTVNLAGEGVGNVSAPGIDCGDGGLDCTEAYLAGTVVNLTAIPDPVSSFAGFSGDPDCADGTVTMDSNNGCTATFNYIPLLLDPIFPGIASNPNIIRARQATPGGSVAFVWGFMQGSTTIGGATCNGTQLGIKNPKLLGIRNAGAQNQVAELIVFIPLIGDFELVVLTQAVDIPTCRKSAVVNNIIRKE